MRRRSSLAAILAAAILGLGAPRLDAAQLELALVIDGSGSISTADWQLQIGAYQNVFQNNFYSTFVAPSTFDSVAVAAYVFSGGFEFSVNDQTFPVSVFSYLDWTLIDDDADAFAFGAQFAGLPQPDGTTATADALNTAANGGLVGCPAFAALCSPAAPLSPPFQLNATGLLNNGFNGDRLVIDISTDGVPTEPNGDGMPNATDRALAIAAADAARAAGITVNAIGVGSLIDADLLEALVGIDPAGVPAGFFVQTGSFAGFQAALEQKVGLEIVPAPPALWLLMTAVVALVARRRVRRRG
jgi:hypothetical protein